MDAKLIRFLMKENFESPLMLCRQAERTIYGRNISLCSDDLALSRAAECVSRLLILAHAEAERREAAPSKEGE